MEERKRMIEQWEAGTSVAELARRFRVSRQTIYEYVRRWDVEGTSGLEDRSRAPHSNPRQTGVEVRNALLNAKQQHPHYGPDKLVRLLANEEIVLSASTARDILRQSGMVKARGARKHRWSPAVRPTIVVPGVGHTMTADHKGQFRMQNRRYCYPLTIAEPASRFVFAIQALQSTNGTLAAPVFERVFREWGLPEQIITDNGPPFCAVHSIGGISQLSKIWIKLGIRHVRIQPGRPQQNGVHERMHRTLKQHTASPPEKNMTRQQGSFDEFKQEFNYVRPHQALGQECPSTRVQRYRREYPNQIAEIEYPSTFSVRRVRSTGQIQWEGQMVFVGEVLIGEQVGFHRVDDECWQLFFGSVHLADWNDRIKKLAPPVATTAPDDRSTSSSDPQPA
jgi:putative transposase